MNDFGCVVIPADLIVTASTGTSKSGWFSGYRVEAESVYIVSSILVGGEKKTSKHAGRLFAHRFSRPGVGDAADELIEWTQVPMGYSDSLRLFQPRARAEVEAELGLRLNPEEKLKCVCTIEATDKFPTVRAFRTFSAETNVILLPLSVLALSRPTPFSSLKKEALDALAPKI